MGWFTRWRERRRELAAGVDADLVQANRQRWKLSLSLWALLFVLLGIQAKIKLPTIGSGILDHLRCGFQHPFELGALDWAHHGNILPRRNVFLTYPRTSITAA